jgi:hypothetical protein
MSVQALCDRLVANDASLTELYIHLNDTNDAELTLILDAAKKNKTVKKVRLDSDGSRSRYRKVKFMSLSVPAALSLASLVSEHPEIQDIEFSRVDFKEFGPIALAIRQNCKAACLLFEECKVTPNLVECIRWLLTENALESMTLKDNYKEDELSFDISGALLGNSSLKKLVLYDDVFGSEIFQAIPHMIRTNQGFETLDLSLWADTTYRFELVRLIAQAAEGHPSLNKLAIAYSGASVEEPSAEDLINHAGTAEAYGTMLHNAPALRELLLSGCYMGSAGARHLADGLSNSVVEELHLPWNKLGDEEAGIFARLLLANQNLKSLDLSSNYIGDAGALELADALRQNNTLELLDLMNGIHRKGAMPQVEHLLALNRGGRRLLSATGESVPPLNYWPRILARSSDNADVLFYFLREIPSVLAAKAGSRKRKRVDHDEATSNM